ncbi:lysophospholipid acyltransferase family protein [Sphingobacterium sp. LRF_L2]|uniref:lysophospholipid acyltransferase family protein n=1 Tax=Sphingobacterium sp. LRF_L2 TaxID=3369421 RepID=UPI003F5DBD00
MLKLLRKIHLYTYFVAILFFFSLAYPFLYFLAKDYEKQYNKIVTIRRWISLAGMYTLGMKVEVDTESDIDWSKNYVICPNHTSFLDITVLTYLCRSPFSFMGKIELLNNPVTRIFFKTIDIPVKRDSKISSFKAYKKAIGILNDGKSLVIFPEGKIDDSYPPILHSFKSGAFKMAVENNIPILPVVIQDAWRILWDDGKKYGSRPGTIHVKILSPIYTDSYDKENLDQLGVEVYSKMKAIWDIQNKS